MHRFSTILVGALLSVAVHPTVSQSQTTEELYELARTDRAAFAQTLSSNSATDFAKARAIVDWLGRNFEWTATDYQDRTVEQIIERRGGNCAELAVVASALFDDLHIRKRRVREINVHVENERRQRTAAEMVRRLGNSRSVFGRRHNDHVWIEVYDEASKSWLPMDPSLGVTGTESWLRARAWFGDRTTLDPTSLEMLFPMAIFTRDDQGNVVNRTQHYMVDELDELYGGALSRLPSWQRWVSALDDLDDLALAAFEGRVNLHEHGDAIVRLGGIYEQLRSEYGTSQ